MTACERVRERLPEHVLGTLNEQDDATVRRHLRGCAGCRAEMSALGEGMASFARAVHDQPPPEELQDRVLAVLDEEWRAEEAPEPTRRRTLSWLAVAAAVAIVVFSVGFGLFHASRAAAVADSAHSYEQLLHILGGEEFRAGELHAAGDHPVEGSIVIYDSHVDQSWVVVFVRTSGLTGPAVATLHAARRIHDRHLARGDRSRRRRRRLARHVGRPRVVRSRHAHRSRRPTPCCRRDR